MRGAAFLTMASVAFATGDIHHDGHNAVQRNSSIKTGVCGDTTWVNESPTGSAYINSCQTLYKNLQELYPPEYGFDLTGWTKRDAYYLWISEAGDCTFEVNVVDADGGRAVPITVADMKDIMGDALSKFSSGDCFGASGVMDCKDGNLSGRLGWRISGVYKEDNGVGCGRVPNSISFN